MSVVITAHYWGRNDLDTLAYYACTLDVLYFNKIKVLFDRLDVEVYNGELWGVCILELDHKLSEDDIEEVKEFINGAISESWGEGYYSIDTPTEEYVLGFDNCDDLNKIIIHQMDMCLTSEEELKLQAPYNYEHLIVDTEFSPPLFKSLPVIDFNIDLDY